VMGDGAGALDAPEGDAEVGDGGVGLGIH
jgi:hypothetical protein